MINSVLIVGGGTCGCQIAWQCALHGVKTTVVEANVAERSNASSRLAKTKDDLVRHRAFPAEHCEMASSRIELLDQDSETARLHEIASNVDLLIESVTEDRDIKRHVFERYSKICPANTIFATNSSYLLPSAFISSVTHPERLAAFHFHVPVWYANAVDIMPHGRTSADVVGALKTFATQIGQVPILSRREQPGYVFNSLLHPLLSEAVSLARREVASPDEIDLAWRSITKMEAGPFDMIRLIGAQTVSRILDTGASMLGNRQLKLNASYLRTLSDQWDERPLSFSSSVTTTNSRPVEPAVDSFGIAWKLDPIDPRLATPPRIVGSVTILATTSLLQSLAASVASSGCEVRPFGNEALAAFENGRADTELDEALVASPHLIVAIGFETDGSQRRGSQCEIYLTLLTRLQHWWKSRMERTISEPSTLIIATPQDAGIGGAARTLFMEVIADQRFYPTVRLVEFSQKTSCGLIADHIVQEMSLAQKQVITGSEDENRRRYYGVQIRRESEQRYRMVLRACDRQNDSGDRSAMLRGTRWLMIGGGRGITHEIAKSLANDYQCHIDLVGRSPVVSFTIDTSDAAEVARYRADVMRSAYRAGQRPDHAWATIEASMQLRQNLDLLELSGAHFSYHAIDVCNRQAFEEWMRHRSEAIRWDGIVYGAGWERTLKFRKRSDEDFRKTLNSKVAGLENLLRFLVEEPSPQRPRWLAVFGSLSGIFGSVGQVDYALANGVACALTRAAACDLPSTKSVVIDWPGWKSVGMASRSASEHALRKAGHHLLSIDEGVELFHESIEHAELKANGSFAHRVLIRASEVPEAMRDDSPTHIERQRGG